MTQGLDVCSKKEGHGGLEAKRGKKKLTKEHGNRVKGAKQSRGSAFPMCSPISSWHTHAHWHRWLPWSKIDMAHLPGPSILFHNMRWGGPRKF